MSEQTTKETKETKPLNKIPLSDRKIGALWIRKNQATGNKTLSVSINLHGKEYSVVGLQNDFFNENPEKQPNYKLYLTEETYTRLLNESKDSPAPKDESVDI